MLRRELPRAAARRPPGHLRHPRRRRPHPGPAGRARRPGRLHRRGTLLRRVPRRPDPGRVHRHHHHPDPPGRRRRARRDHPRVPARNPCQPGRGRAHQADDRRARRRRAGHLPGRAWTGQRQLRDPRPGLGRPSTAPGCPRTGTSPPRPARSLGWVAASAVSDRLRLRRRRRALHLRPPRRPRPRHRAPRCWPRSIGSTEAAGIWTIQTGIFPENTASLRLHRAAGFRVVGTRQRIGCHHGRWRDVVLLERRSTTTGTCLTRSRPGLGSAMSRDRTLGASRRARTLAVQYGGHGRVVKRYVSPARGSWIGGQHADDHEGSSAAVPMHPAAPARATGRYRVLSAANGEQGDDGHSARPGRSAAGTGPARSRPGW